MTEKCEPQGWHCTCRLQNIQLCQIYEKVGLMFLTLEKIFFFAG